MAFFHGEPVTETSKDVILNKIREIVRSYPADDYDAALREDADWMVFYHMSEMRKAILNWYEFDPKADLLEIGAGYGALTGLFCERCASVSCLEYYPSHAAVLYERHQDKSNLEIYAGTIDELKAGRQFDYITMVGSLEFQGGGTSDPKTYAEYLKKAKLLLKPNGKLLIAVENRYGIRNFCGAPEPFTKVPFAGINHYPCGTKAYAFDRQEITDILKEAGFQDLKFYYPLPDHKLPQVIYSDRYLPKENLKERVIPYYPNSALLVAYERDLYSDLIKNRVFEFFSNSYLIECGLAEDFCDVVYAAVSIDRGKENSFITAIHRDQHVTKYNVYRESQEAEKVYENIMRLAKNGINVVEHRYEGGILHMPYIDSPTLSEHMGILIRQDPAEFLGLLDLLNSEILRSSASAPQERNALGGRCDDSEGWGTILEISFIDMIPLNCFYKENRLLFFDQEFLRRNYPAKYTLYRAIKYLYMTFPYIEQSLPLDELKKRYGFSNAIWEVCEQEESKFVAENRRLDINRTFYQWADVDLERIYSYEKKY